MKISFLYVLLGIILPSLGTAKPYTFEEALLNYKNLKLEMPKSDPDGRIQTLNKKGATSPVVDEATSEFIKFSKGKKVLEIGGAYGLVAVEVLKQSPETIYHLNDIDERHLFIAAEYISSKNLPENHLKNLTLEQFDISNATPREKYDAILVARVLHFLNPEQLDKSVKFLAKSLNPQGRVYIVGITPYVKKYQKFIPEYEKRLKYNAPNPGYVLSLKDWVGDDIACDPKQMNVISSDPFMFLDENVLTHLFEKNGFKILKCATADLGYHSDMWCLDGRENVILIAEKE
jgi:SAM-dependent methyltransferase